MPNMYMSFIVSLDFRSYSIAYFPNSATTKSLLSEFHWECVKLFSRLMLQVVVFVAVKLSGVPRKKIKKHLVVKYKTLSNLLCRFFINVWKKV